MSDKPTINIDGTEHVVEDLSDVAKGYIGQLQSIVSQTKELQNRLQQAEVARLGFIDLLKKEVQK